MKIFSSTYASCIEENAVSKEKAAKVTEVRITEEIYFVNNGKSFILSREMAHEEMYFCNDWQNLKTDKSKYYDNRATHLLCWGRGGGNNCYDTQEGSLTSPCEAEDNGHSTT